MKPFSQWLGEQAESIVDTSHIGPHTHKPVTVPDDVQVRVAEGWSLDREQVYKDWLKSFEQKYEDVKDGDYDDSYFD